MITAAIFAVPAWNVILPAPSMTGTDAETIRAVLSGETDRYAKLVDKYQGPAIRIAFSFLGNYEDARDISQEAFVSAYRSLGRFRATAKFSTWLYRIVINECKDAYRRRAHQPRVVARVGEVAAGGGSEEGLFIDVPDPGADPGAASTNRELSLRLSASIRTLPMQQRTAFLLHHVHGCSLEETAAMMGCRVGTVKSHVFRATESLREALTPWLAQERG